MQGRHEFRPGRCVGITVALLATLAPARGPARGDAPGPPAAAVDFATLAGVSDGHPPGPDQPGTTLSIPGREETGSTLPAMQMGLFETIAESLVGDAYAEGRWRPLTLGTFFSDGWLEPWAGGPAGREGLTPRHGWLGAFRAVFYRLWMVSFSDANRINAGLRGDRYTGLYQIFLPLSRRFEVLVSVPFVVSNGTRALGRGYTSEFGDLVITPRFLLSESVATTHLFGLDIRTPTGTRETGNGVAALQPRYEFWTNPGGPWVVRGGLGLYTPMNQARIRVHAASTGDLAIGRYFTPHDAPFGDLVFYAACNWNVPLDRSVRSGTFFGIGPGTRFHIAKDYFFLHYWEFPLTGPHPFASTMQLALVKIF